VNAISMQLSREHLQRAPTRYRSVHSGHGGASTTDSGDPGFQTETARRRHYAGPKPSTSLARAARSLVRGKGMDQSNVTQISPSSRLAPPRKSVRLE